MTATTLFGLAIACGHLLAHPTFLLGLHLHNRRTVTPVRQPQPLTTPKAVILP